MLYLKQWLERMSASIQSQRKIEHPSLRGLPSELKRSLSFRKNQSLNDKSQNVEHAKSLAKDVSEALSSLLIRSIFPNRAEQESAIAKLLRYDDMVDQMLSQESVILKAEQLNVLDPGLASQLRTAIAQENTQYLLSQKSESPTPDLFGTTILLMTLLRIWWLEQIRKNPAKTN